MKTLIIEGQDIRTITDFKTLNEIKSNRIDKAPFLNKMNLVAYLSPKNENQRKIFEREFVVSGRNMNELKDGSVLRRVFSNYENMELEIYTWSVDTSHAGNINYRQSLIDLINGNNHNPIII